MGSNRLREFGIRALMATFTAWGSPKVLRDSATSSQDVDSTLYRQLIGSLMYLMHMRPDICYTVNALSQFMSDPKHIHWVATKHVLRYVQGTITYGLRYTSSSGLLLAGYVDSD